ncbi:MAG: cob(I)yrinic acid a,c-diamide adenosyltransferase [Nitrospiraceae bacterium]
MTIDESAHREKMQRVKAAVDARIAAAQTEKGLLLVYTGPGKGKTTAALGMVLRALGHGMKVAVIQFIKGAIDSAEERVLRTFGEQLVFLRMGEGYTWDTQDRARDVQHADAAWQQAATFLADPTYGLVVLDEFNIVLKQQMVDLHRVLPVLAARPPMQHVVSTGRGAPPALIEAADLVTEMAQVKHPFRHGIKAQAGVEF